MITSLIILMYSIGALTFFVGVILFAIFRPSRQ